MVEGQGVGLVGVTNAPLWMKEASVGRADHVYPKRVGTCAQGL